jgi:hypothetical protein
VFGDRYANPIVTRTGTLLYRASDVYRVTKKFSRCSLILLRQWRIVNYSYQESSASSVILQPYRLYVISVRSTEDPTWAPYDINTYKGILYAISRY